MPKLLIVDDQEPNRYLLEVLLKGHGHQVVSASNGSQALDLAHQDPPDLIITDILMPVMDGFALCRRWKKDPALCSIPFVFYTATYTDPKDEKFALGLGAARFIIKPTEPDVFLKIVNEVLDEFHSGRLPASCEDKDEEEVFLKEYNQALVHKLEDKLTQLEKANLALQDEIGRHNRSQKELARSEERFSKVFHCSPHGLVIATAKDGKILEVNRAFCRESGYSREDLLGRTADEMGLWGDREAVKKALDIIREQGALHEYVIPCVHASGRTILVSWSAEPIELDGKDYLISVLADVTERKHTEQALKASEERYRTLMEAVADPVIVYDLAGRVVYVNKAFSKVFGWTSQEVLGHRLDFVPPEEMPEVERRIQEALQGRMASNFEARRKTKSGSLIDVSISAAGFKDAQGQAAGIVVSLQDITARKAAEQEKYRLEAQLRQAQKMEAIGTLAGGIAHDFNNILGVIIGFAELSILTAGGDEQMKHNLQKVLDAGLRAKDLVKQILTFSRQTEQEFKPIHSGQVVTELVEMLRATVPPSIEIETRSVQDCVVMADYTQLHQVLMNICTNAVQAMQGERGLLEIALDQVELDENSARLVHDIKPGLYQRITITDNGRGIPPGVLERIFDPFFTTKKKGEGTGLGLSVAHGIIKNHNGKITAYSEPGKGTTFSIYLPVLQSQDETGAAAPTAARLPTGTESILYVDDEELLTEVGSHILGALGYRVNGLVSSLAALEAFRKNPAAYDLVVTDLNMPKMTGVELAREIHGIRSDIPIILCTGFSERVSADVYQNIGVRKLIMKPIVAKEIAKVVRGVLDQK